MNLQIVYEPGQLIMKDRIFFSFHNMVTQMIVTWELRIIFVFVSPKNKRGKFNKKTLAYPGKDMVSTNLIYICLHFDIRPFLNYRSRLYTLS